MAPTHGPHSTISSFDPGYQGENSLEMVFHEAAHGDLTSDPLQVELEAAFSQRGERLPRQLTHAVHFFTIGEIAYSEAQKHGITYSRVDQEVIGRAWSTWREPLEKHWRSYLQGGGERAAAVAALVDAVIAAEKKPK